jgi:hemolysin III
MQATALAPPRTPTLQAIEEEIFNGLTHGIGVVLSIAGFWGLLSLTEVQGSPWHFLACAIYGGSLVTLYTVSTLYHSTQNPWWKERLRLCDHMCIFLTIAGTYTPFTLISLQGAWGWTLFAMVWSLAAIGIWFKLRYRYSMEYVSLALYLSMGWVALLAIKPILETMPLGAVLWVLAGGAAYSIGTIFYVCDERRYFHAIWHVFVLAGSVLHYCAVLFYVVPLGV